MCVHLRFFVFFSFVSPFLISLSSGVPQMEQLTPHRLPRAAAATYGITHLDINKSLKRLERSFRSLEGKLSRHEGREAQVADFSTKTLNKLLSDNTLMQKTIHMLARQLAKMEERIISTESLMQTTDERQRSILSNMNEGLNRLLSQDPAFSDTPPYIDGAGELDFYKISNNVNSMSEHVENGIKLMSNEVRILGESLEQHMNLLTTRLDRLWNAFSSCEGNHIQLINTAAQSLRDTGDLFLLQISEAKKLMQNSGNDDCSLLTNEVVGRLDDLDKVYQDQEKDLQQLNKETHITLIDQAKDIKALLTATKLEKETSNKSFGGVLQGLQELKTASNEKLGTLGKDIRNTLQENANILEKHIRELTTTADMRNKNIISALDDTAAQSENMQNTMMEGFEDLASEIRGIKRVEQVMINTADAVLDTKRSIEFGIQQVILELSDTVKHSGRTINSTLSDQINNISMSILKSQTSALSNMTSKMETEISQVWRQIGIMYEQVAQSVNILDDLHDTTSQQMNVSLTKVGSMDGTVGKINSKVADVEENLNYLLGRLSLIVTDFSTMRTSVGAELERLRKMAHMFSELPEYKSVDDADKDDPGL